MIEVYVPDDADPSAPEPVLEGLQTRLVAVAEQLPLEAQAEQIRAWAELIPSAAEAYPDTVAALAVTEVEERTTPRALRAPLARTDFYEVWHKAKANASRVEKRAAHELAAKTKRRATIEHRPRDVEEMTSGVVKYAVREIGTALERATLAALAPDRELAQVSRKARYWPGVHLEPALPTDVRETMDALAARNFARNLTEMVEGLETAVGSRTALTLDKELANNGHQDVRAAQYQFDRNLSTLGSFLTQGTLPPERHEDLQRKVLNRLAAAGLLPKTGAQQQEIIENGLEHLETVLSPRWLIEWLKREVGPEVGVTPNGKGTAVEAGSLGDHIAFMHDLLSDVALPEQNLENILNEIVYNRSGTGQYTREEVEAAYDLVRKRVRGEQPQDDEVIVIGRPAEEAPAKNEYGNVFDRPVGERVRRHLAPLVGLGVGSLVLAGALIHPTQNEIIDAPNDVIEKIDETREALLEGRTSKNLQP